MEGPEISLLVSEESQLNGAEIYNIKIYLGICINKQSGVVL